MKNTAEALRVFDADRPRRDRLWDSVQTAMDVGRCVHEDEKAADLVRAAFFEETKHINSKDRAFLVHPDDLWLRRIVSKFISEVAQT